MFVPFNTLLTENYLRYPERSALSYNNFHYSYHELNQRVHQLACYFKYKGVKQGMLIAIISKAPLKRIISILALWKLGAAYLPIDPNYPLARINFILKDSKVNFIITDKTIYKNYFKTSPLKFILLENLTEEAVSPSYLIENIETCTKVNDIAYVAYTSGSTGNPKAAVITQGNVSSICQAWQQVYSLTYTDRHLQIANFGFDVCSGDIIRALGSGAQLEICPSAIILQPKLLHALLKKTDITIAEFTPIILRKLVAYLKQEGLDLHFMRLLICGSDSWYMKEYRNFQSFLSSDARLINSYGTTETTIDSTYFEIGKKLSHNLGDKLMVPLGKPFPNTLIKIINEKFEECPLGIQGEICIGGEGVSLGYLNQEHLTKKKFIKLPISSMNNKNNFFYRTGDLGHYSADGNLHFLGRIDDQIKIMGNRVDLIEVEETLNQYSGIDKGIVMAHPTLKSGEKLLVTFIMTNQTFKIKDCLVFLKKHLPEYAIPIFYIPISYFPMSYHGKLDKGKLASKLTYKNDPQNKSHQRLDSVKENLLTILLSNFNIYNVCSDSCFFNLNTNIIFFSRLVAEIEQYYNLKLQPSDFLNTFTIDALVALLKIKLGDKSHNMIKS